MNWHICVGVYFSSWSLLAFASRVGEAALADQQSRSVNDTFTARSNREPSEDWTELLPQEDLVELLAQDSWSWTR